MQKLVLTIWWYAVEKRLGTPGLVVEVWAEVSSQRGPGFESRHILDGWTRYYIYIENKRKSIKVGFERICDQIYIPSFHNNFCDSVPKYTLRGFNSIQKIKTGSGSF